MENQSSTSTMSNSTNGINSDPQKVVERVAQTAHETVDRVAAAAAPALERLRSSATNASGTLQAKADQLGQMQEEWIANARNYVRENPLAAVGIAVAAGWLIGRLGRSD